MILDFRIHDPNFLANYILVYCPIFIINQPRNGGEVNEACERQVFGFVTEVVKFGEDLVVVNDQITLLFVKTNDDWKMVHEHHSPLKK